MHGGGNNALSPLIRLMREKGVCLCACMYVCVIVCERQVWFNKWEVMD